MTDDLRIKIEDLEKRLSMAESRLGIIISDHNYLYDKHVQLLKSYNDNSAWIGHELTDLDERLAMVMNMVAPEQLAFDKEIGRVFKSKDRR